MSILLVEDEWITLVVATFALEDAGFSVVTAATGAQAVAHLKTYPGHFTCLISDFNLSEEVTGAHVVREMRKSYPSIPIIIASAMTGMLGQDWCLQHRVDLLQKPYATEELVKLVVQLIGQV